MSETWQERIERDQVEGKAVARGERAKAKREDAATPELCLDWATHLEESVACLQPKGHAGAHRHGPTHWVQRV